MRTISTISLMWLLMTTQLQPGCLKAYTSSFWNNTARTFLTRSRPSSYSKLLWSRRLNSSSKQCKGRRYRTNRKILWKSNLASTILRCYSCWKSGAMHLKLQILMKLLVFKTESPISRTKKAIWKNSANHNTCGSLLSTASAFIQLLKDRLSSLAHIDWN